MRVAQLPLRGSTGTHPLPTVNRAALCARKDRSAGLGVPGKTGLLATAC